MYLDPLTIGIPFGLSLKQQKRYNLILVFLWNLMGYSL
jgi:hypothetical protein